MTNRPSSTAASPRSQPQPGRDRGSASLELVVLFPVVLLLVFSGVQAGLWWHARTVAATAAAEGLRAGSAYGSTAGKAETAARDLITDAGSGALIGPNINAARGAQTITVTVTGHSPSLLPGVRMPAIRQSAAGPVERFTSWSSP